MAVKDLVKLFEGHSVLESSPPPARESISLRPLQTPSQPSSPDPDRSSKAEIVPSKSQTEVTEEDLTDYATTLNGEDHASVGLLARPESGASNQVNLPQDESLQDDTSPLIQKAENHRGHPHHVKIRHPTNRRNSQSHTPIPAIVVFASKAPQVYLPKLDRYLSSIEPPDFSHLTHDSSRMFIPMDRLAKTGKSLEDLETNSQVPPVWRNSKTILGTVVNFMIGIMGSSALASFYSLQGLFNTIQIFALILNTIVPVGHTDIKKSWRQIFLGTIPNILAFNFATTLQQSLIYLLIFMAITAGLLYHFYKSTRNCKRYGTVEGLQSATAPKKSSGWGIVIVSFLLTVIYLPLSTMAIHVLVWSSDLWAVPNPYINATSLPPDLPALGPPNEFRDPLDFCWTTTMRKNEINWAPVIIILSLIVISFLTIWFPIALRRIISQSVPKVDKFTELGRARSPQDMDTEYHRLLSRDQNTFAFLYSGFRRGWSTYESIYLWAKFSTLLMVAVIDSDNCLLRNAPRKHVDIARQVLLLLAMIAFFVAQCVFAPFLDAVNNASEWTSRMNYILTSIIALAVACGIPGENALNTYVLYSVYVITYGLSIYFTIINWGITQRLVKRLTKRIDFSIDIFSPRLDISFLSIHTRRRIWQESVSTLLLTNTDCAIPAKQQMKFAQAQDSEYPPYLLDFCGTPGERHVENLKILRDVGGMAYSKAVALLSGPDAQLYRTLGEEIQKHYVGPDCFWKDTSGDLDQALPACSHFFGNAWWIPFPPTLVMHYDSGKVVTLTHAHDLESYILQNSSSDVQKRRRVRVTLRALEGQRVHWPYEHVISQGSSFRDCFGRWKYGAKNTVFYNSCVLKIKRSGDLTFRGVQLGSGFDVELVYSKHLTVSSDIIGLNDDYDLTAPLAKFFHTNKRLIHRRVTALEDILVEYRRYHSKIHRQKQEVLSYGFLTRIYDYPLTPDRVAHELIRHERDLRVRQLVAENVNPLSAAHERFEAVSKTYAAIWWYIFWDDFWRRNHDTIPALTKHAPDFSPHYATSIAYTPLSRPILEAFLAQRGLYSARGKLFITSGLLNKIYVRLNDIVFQHTGQAIMFHLGDGSTERDMMGIDIETRAGQSSTMGTGGGTNHDNASILIRPFYRWEGILLDEVGKGKKGHRRLLAKLGTWFGIAPNWRAGTPTSGLSLDLKLEKGSMPRRPRPVHRAPPSLDAQKNTRNDRKSAPKEVKKAKVPVHPKPILEEESEDESAGSDSGDGFFEGEDSGGMENEESEQDWVEEEEELPDAPRIAQWEDEDDLDKPGPSTLKTLQQDLASLPLGALRKARLALPEAVAEDSDSDKSESEAQSDADEAESSEEEVTTSKGDSKFGKDRVIAKRSNKHAPVEITSKKPVTRRIQAVDVKKHEARDPRFLPLAGEFSAQKFRHAYGFITENHQKEMNTLKDNLKRARKLLATSPGHLYEEREEEVKRLELAVKRAESQVDRDRKEKVEHDALTKLTKEEKQKRKEGKGEWYMKKTNKREILARARYDALAAEGGNRAVKKAIEKKQKKIGQKEKKSRPFSMKRKPDAGSVPSGRDSKRRKVG